MTTTTITLALATLDWSLHADAEQAQAFADDHDRLVVASADDLLVLTGPQAVSLYNATAKHIPNLAPVARFSDKKVAAKRIWSNLCDLVAAADEAAAAAPKPAKADKARDRAKPAKVTDYPAPAPRPVRRGTGVNLVPARKAYPCREGSKQAKMVDMLFRPQGATMSELLEALSGGAKPWQEVTVKSGLNWDMNKIKGYGIRTRKRGDEDCYHLVLPQGMDEPHPHTPRKGTATTDLVTQIKEWARENYSKSYGASALIETKTDDELRSEFKSLAAAKRWAKLATEQYQNAQG